MKASIVFLVIFLSFSSYAQNTDYLKAKEILKERFVSLDEARVFDPELPEIMIIPYSEITLRDNVNSWLVPLLSNGIYKYMLVYASYPLYNGDIIETRDTLNINEAKQLIYLLGNIRPNFPNLYGYTSLFDGYLFRTKDGAFNKNGICYKKTLSYSLFNKNQLIVVDLPCKMISGFVRSNYFTCLIDKTLFVESFPNSSINRDQKSLFIWDLIYIIP